MRGRVNSGEVPIKAVMFVERKLLNRSDQKGMWPGTGPQRYPATDDAPPAQRRDLPHAEPSTERGKPAASPQGKARRKAS